MNKNFNDFMEMFGKQNNEELIQNLIDKYGDNIIAINFELTTVMLREYHNWLKD